MTSIERILVAVGADAQAPLLIARAAALARRLTGAYLRLAASVYDPYVAGERFPDSPDLDHAREGLVDARRAPLLPRFFTGGKVRWRRTATRCSGWRDVMGSPNPRHNWNPTMPGRPYRKWPGAAAPIWS